MTTLRNGWSLFVALRFIEKTKPFLSIEHDVESISGRQPPDATAALG